MAGSSSEESGVGRSFEGISNGQQRYQSGEALAEWRSSEQVENGVPSISPPYWDTDDDDDDCVAKPSELFGKYTWKIEDFSKINKRELRSDQFEVGGRKWYILIYPQGCDVSNHLSLFLCVANHDNLNPGWSHFAQFTIAVVNKDPKKSKYSDTLHRFWKKEHDWGWKKFMELSKVLDGFIDADTLIIKAQVQVIRERVDRPFRCLDCQYRRELVRVYLTNVEQICRRFVEEKRGKLGKLLEDKARWSSFCTFWLGMDQNARRRMSREKSDSILKVIVKQFFVEKEVTSTLVMDSLNSGLKALEGRGRSLEAEELPVPIVRMEKDTFVLVDDVLLLLERATLEPLPPKDEKGPQNRTKDGGSGEDFTKDSIERDERRLTELGRRTIEIFVLAHIFSKIEVAYQEAVALKRQEELIREEEAAWMAESEQKAKRGASEKEKKAKKKQGKQKRNNRKAKDEKALVTVDDKAQQESATNGTKNFLIGDDADSVPEKTDILEDVSDASDTVDYVPEALQPDSDDQDSSPVNWDTDTSEAHPPTDDKRSGKRGLSAVQNGDTKSASVMDDSSSTCSTDSLPSVVMNGTHKGNNSIPNLKSQKSPSRGRSQKGKSASHEATGGANGVRTKPSEVLSDVGQGFYVTGPTNKVDELEISLQDRIKWLEEHVVKKVEQVVSLQKKLNVKDDVDTERPIKEKTSTVSSSPGSPSKNLPAVVRMKATSAISASAPVIARRPSDNSQQTNKATGPTGPAETSVTPKPYSHKGSTPKPTEKPTSHQVPLTAERPTNNHGPVTSEKPMAHQGSGTSEKSMSNHGPVTSEKPMAHQGSGTSEKPMSNHGPVTSEKPMAHQGSGTSEKTTSNHGPVTSERPVAHQGSGTSERPVAYQGSSTTTSEKHATQQVSVPLEKPASSQVGPGMSRPLSAPLIPGPRPSTPAVSSMVQTAPSLSRSVSAAGRLGPEPPSTASHIYGPQSYRNAMMGNPSTSSTANINQSHPSSSHFYSQPTTIISAPIFLPQSSERMESNNTIRPPTFSFGMVNHDAVQNGGAQWPESSQRDTRRSLHSDPSSLIADIHNLDLYKSTVQVQNGRSQDQFPTEFAQAGTSGRQTHGMFAEEFPHLDIINDLLDDEHVARVYPGFPSYGSGPHHLNRQFTFPGDIGGPPLDQGTSTSSCRFERTHSYQGEFQRGGYGGGVPPSTSVGGQFDLSRDTIPYPNLQQAYTNEELDGLIQNQWHIGGGGSDLSYMGMRNMEGDGYPGYHHIAEYPPNMANGYNVYRPNNGQ